MIADYIYLLLITILIQPLSSTNNKRLRNANIIMNLAVIIRQNQNFNLFNVTLWSRTTAEKILILPPRRYDSECNKNNQYDANPSTITSFDWLKTCTHHTWDPPYDWTIPRVTKITTQRRTRALFARNKLVFYRFSK